MRPLRLALSGAAGRTGSRVVAAAVAAADISLVAALEDASCPALGRDAGSVAGLDTLGIALTAEPGAAFDVLVDFSTPAGTRTWVTHCIEHRIPIVIGTTGLEATDEELLERAGLAIPVVRAPNMSLGVNVLLRLVRTAASLLEDADVEIVETHHRGKRDVPSGTALRLRDAVREARGGTPRTLVGRREDGARTDEIGIHSVRLGAEPGRHVVALGTGEEIVTLEHRALSRDAYARGALHAARWVVGREPGLHDMQDVLFGDSGLS